MYHSIQDIIDVCNEENMEFWEVVQRADMDERAASSAESWTNMANMYQAMKDADKSYNARLRSASGLAGGDGEKLRIYNESGRNNDEKRRPHRNVRKIQSQIHNN